MKKVEVTVKYLDNGDVVTHVYTEEFNTINSLYMDAVLELAGILPPYGKYPLVDSIEITLADNEDRGAIIKCDKRNNLITVYPKYRGGVQESAKVLQYEFNNSLWSTISIINDALLLAVLGEDAL